MKISCPSCKKKFNLDESLIPENGRLLQCGFCNHKWFYEKNTKLINEYSEPNILSEPSLNENLTKKSSSVDTSIETQIPKETETIINQAEENIKKTSNNKIDNQAKKSDKVEGNIISNFLSYLIVIIISLIAMIILLDTFKAPLINIFPILEHLLSSLYETLKDIKLFIIDLT